MRKVSLLITDLDNTLYDWVSSFVPAFYAMVERASEILSIDQESLLDELRSVHQRHGNAEHPFALLETKIVAGRLNSLSYDEQRVTLDPAFYAFNSARKRSLTLYDGVEDTLQAITAAGVPIVAHTDARAPNSLYRIRALGLERYISRLYTPRQMSASLHLTAPINETDFLRLLPSEDRKPHPKTLIDICKDFGVSPEEALYVGDSLSRDIYMASSAGTLSAWARYGTEVDPSMWSRLVRVTHWTDADIRRESSLKAEASNVRPDETLFKFSDILNAFCFNKNTLPPS